MFLLFVEKFQSLPDRWSGYFHGQKHPSVVRPRILGIDQPIKDEIITLMIRNEYSAEFEVESV
jgi:hypothetical protein